MAEGSAELTIAAIFDAELVRQIAVTDLIAVLLEHP
jgi:hypothetical protein